MADLDLAAIKAREQAATKGPWEVRAGIGSGDMDVVANGVFVAYDMDTQDAEFIAHACQDIPALLAEVKQLRERVEELEPFEPHLREMHMGPGGWSMTIQQAKNASGAFVAAAKAMLDGHDAENYVEQEMFLGSTTKERYMIIYVRPGKKGPHQLRREAEAETARIRAELAEYYEENVRLTAQLNARQDGGDQS